MNGIKEKIAEAVELTKDVEPEIMPIAFRVVLEKLLSVSHETTTQMMPRVKSPKVFIELANQCRISLENVHHVFDIDEDKKAVRIICQINGNEKEKQVTATLIYMTAKYFMFDEQTATSRELTTVMENLGIGSLANLAKNLGDQAQWFVLEQGSGSRVGGYKITVPGLTKGKETIKQAVMEVSNAKG